MLQLVKPTPAQCQLKNRRDVPSDQSKGGGTPANGGVRQSARERFHETQAEKRGGEAARKRPRQSAQEGQRRRAKQDQRRGNDHEQEMLHHVNGER